MEYLHRTETQYLLSTAAPPRFDFPQCRTNQIEHSKESWIPIKGNGPRPHCSKFWFAFANEKEKQEGNRLAPCYRFEIYFKKLIYNALQNFKAGCYGKWSSFFTEKRRQPTETLKFFTEKWIGDTKGNGLRA